MQSCCTIQEAVGGATQLVVVLSKAHVPMLKPGRVGAVRVLSSLEPCLKKPRSLTTTRSGKKCRCQTEEEPKQ